MAFLEMPDKRRSEELGIGQISHIPVIWSKDWKLMAEASKYLTSRGLGQWAPRMGKQSLYSIASKPAANSMLLYARNLEHFLTYCERRNLEWQEISYEQLLNSYQTEMHNGQAANSGGPLSPGTINNRVDTACDFLTYAAAQGWRRPFAVSSEPIRRSAASGNRTSSTRRVGRVRANPADLRLPTRSEIKNWLECVLRGFPGVLGITAYMMCRMVIETAMRAEEVILFRADQLPNPDSIDPSEQAVFIPIKYGTKGGRDPQDIEKRGKVRSIRMSREWLVRLNDYKRMTRKLALKVHKELYPGATLPKELFLSPCTGMPYSYSRFREFWVQKGLLNKCLPFEAWSPHAGRHTWACYQLLERMEAELDVLRFEMKASRGEATTPSIEWTTRIGETLIKLHVQPFLGHVNQETTDLYLRWLAGQVQSDRYVREWSHWLDS